MAGSDTEREGDCNLGYRGKLYGVGMDKNITTMKSEAQETLDDLFAKGQLPFALHARAVESIGMEEYIVRFYDSRIFSVDVSYQRGQTFKTVFTTAIVERVARLRSAPLLARTA